jgi:hypothetical protein
MIKVDEFLYSYLYGLPSLDSIKDLIYNKQLPNEDLQEFILIKNLGGTFDEVNPIRNYNFEIVTQSVNNSTAENYSQLIFDEINQFYGLNFIDNSNDLFISSIKADGFPLPLGNQNGLYQFSTVYKIIIGGNESLS